MCFVLGFCRHALSNAEALAMDIWTDSNTLPHMTEIIYCVGISPSGFSSCCDLANEAAFLVIKQTELQLEPQAIPFYTHHYHKV